MLLRLAGPSCLWGLDRRWRENLAGTGMSPSSKTRELACGRSYGNAKHSDSRNWFASSRAMKPVSFAVSSRLNSSCCFGCCGWWSKTLLPMYWDEVTDRSLIPAAKMASSSLVVVTYGWYITYCYACRTADSSKRSEVSECWLWKTSSTLGLCSCCFEELLSESIAV